MISLFNCWFSRIWVSNWSIEWWPTSSWIKLGGGTGNRSENGCGIQSFLLTATTTQVYQRTLRRVKPWSFPQLCNYVYWNWPEQSCSTTHTLINSWCAVVDIFSWPGLHIKTKRVNQLNAQDTYVKTLRQTTLLRLCELYACPTFCTVYLYKPQQHWYNNIITLKQKDKRKTRA